MGQDEAGFVTTVSLLVVTDLHKHLLMASAALSLQCPCPIFRAGPVAERERDTRTLSNRLMATFTYHGVLGTNPVAGARKRIHSSANINSHISWLD